MKVPQVMMKLNKKQKSQAKRYRPLIIVIAVIVVCGLAGYGVYRLIHHVQRMNSLSTTKASTIAGTSTSHVNYGPATQQEQQESNQQKQALTQQNNNSSSSPTTDNSISVSISRANQSAASQPLNIRTVISGISSGTCNVTLTQSGQTAVTASFPITYQATYATCDNANIPASSFGASGNWNLSITATSGSYISPAATMIVTIAK